jgi:protein-S-isoprenylcysteine O-methyltransferase Ste14
MSRIAILFLMILSPALAIFLALLGLETLQDNFLGWFLLVLGIAYPAGSIIYYFIRREPFWNSTQAGGRAREETGDRSFWLILPGFLVIFFASPLEWMYLPGLMPRLSWIQAAGLGLILAAVALRVWTRAHLRGLYSGHVEVLAGHRLVQSGPYRFVRHPGYTGFLLMTLGVAIGYSSLIGLAAVPVLLLPGLAYRMKVEEHLLNEQFGDDYRTYIRKSKKLIPGIW